MSSQDAAELNESIRQYEAQLGQINAALSCTEPGEGRDGLLSLKADIQQLISLTAETLGTSESPCSRSTSDNDPFADEYALFKAELEEAESSSKVKEAQDSTKGDGAAFEKPDDLDDLQGSKCQAPFMHPWGESYHNALVFHVVPNDEMSPVNEIMVRVMFTNPTHSKMLPCPYYLDGECRFSDEKCRFSHGELVKLSSLREYREPNFSKVRENSFVLARHEKDKLWHRGKVLAKNKADTWMVRLESVGGGMIEVNLKDILPMESSEDDHDSDFDCDDDENDDEDDDEDGGDTNESDKSQEIDDDESVRILQAPASSELGAWEKHTKGMGSRLMERMGYVAGTGLGVRGEGRIEPVKAVIIPAGKSLDHCMIMRERKAQGLKPRMRRRNKFPRKGQTSDDVKPRSNVFDFLNTQLGDKPTTSNNMNEVLKAKSHQNLNVASLQVAEEIRKAERDLVHLRQSLHRQAVGSKSHTHMLAKLNVKKSELGRLQQSEQKIAAEQGRRKDHKKLAVF